MNNKSTKKLILFGGNQALFNLVLNIINSKLDLDLVVISEEFHLRELINNEGSLLHNLEKYNIPYESFSDLTKGNLQDYVAQNTIGLSISSPWIFKEEVISLFEGKLFNFHSALLPYNRGAGIISWKILTNDRVGGLTIHKLTKGIDDGDIIKQKKFSYPNECVIPLDYFNYEAEKIDDFLLEFVKEIIACKDWSEVKQDETVSTYWPRLNTEINGFIDWSWSCQNVIHFVNAFDDPYRGASTFTNNQKVYLKKCSPQDDHVSFHPFQSGLVYRISSDAIFVAGYGGSFLIKCVFDEKGNNIINKTKLGQRFFTPRKYLEDAQITRVQYGPQGLKL
ncbi:MAG TPA: hypothetical protein DCS13_04955 [Candidatus Margulisbacteria bacterium]|nr:MAG: hypothetical protein A2X43_00220 [Candidatus Margulisbacteria bacterium GWD2_39_127]HAR62794.1 hypothetical protein [Candidatus Margulisiibacteriota bacterium]